MSERPRRRRGATAERLPDALETLTELAASVRWGRAPVWPRSWPAVPSWLAITLPLPLPWAMVATALRRPVGAWLTARRV